MDGPISSSSGGRLPASGDGESKGTIAEKRAFGFCPMIFWDEVAGAFKRTKAAIEPRKNDRKHLKEIWYLKRKIVFWWAASRAAFKRAAIATW